MTPDTIREYQAELVSRFTMAGLETAHEWRARLSAIGAYSPRLDVAAGPFPTDDRHEGPIYDALQTTYADFLATLHGAHDLNVKTYSRDRQVFELGEMQRANYNARCFLAVEIENRVSRKHLLGGAINAAALGRLGLVVGWDEGKVKALVRTKCYLEFLAGAGKPTFPTMNLLVLGRAQLHSALDSLPFG